MRVNVRLLLPLLHLARLIIPLQLLVVEHVIDLERPVEDLCPAEVVDRQDGRALVGVHHEREAFRLLRVGVARHRNVDDLAVPAG